MDAGLNQDSPSRASGQHGSLVLVVLQHVNSLEAESEPGMTITTSRHLIQHGMDLMQLVPDNSYLLLVHENAVLHCPMVQNLCEQTQNSRPLDSCTRANAARAAMSPSETREAATAMVLNETPSNTDTEELICGERNLLVFILEELESLKLVVTLPYQPDSGP
eukprot:766716-Hanusia_phi.AAC.4